MSLTCCPRATVVWFWFEWNGPSQSRGTRFESFVAKASTRCFPFAEEFRARKFSRRLSNFRRDLPARCQHADCRNLAGSRRPAQSRSMVAEQANGNLPDQRTGLFADQQRRHVSIWRRTGALPSGSFRICQETPLSIYPRRFLASNNRRAIKQTIYRFVSCRIGRETSNETGDAGQAYFSPGRRGYFLKRDCVSISNGRQPENKGCSVAEEVRRVLAAF